MSQGPRQGVCLGGGGGQNGKISRWDSAIFFFDRNFCGKIITLMNLKNFNNWADKEKKQEKKNNCPSPPWGRAGLCRPHINLESFR